MVIPVTPDQSSVENQKAERRREVSLRDESVVFKPLKTKCKAGSWQQTGKTGDWMVLAWISRRGDGFSFSVVSPTCLSLWNWATSGPALRIYLTIIQLSHTNTPGEAVLSLLPLSILLCAATQFCSFRVAKNICGQRETKEKRWKQRASRIPLWDMKRPRNLLNYPELWSCWISILLLPSVSQLIRCCYAFLARKWGNLFSGYSFFFYILSFFLMGAKYVKVKYENMPFMSHSVCLKLFRGRVN